MASSADYLDYVLDFLAGVPEMAAARCCQAVAGIARNRNLHGVLLS